MAVSAQAEGRERLSGLPPLLGMVRTGLNPSRGSPCTCEMLDLPSALRYASLLCLDAKHLNTVALPAKLEAALAKENLPPGLAEAIEDDSLSSARIVASRDDLLTAVGILGTHGGKFPDARIDVGGMFALPGLRGNEAPGIHGGTVASSCSVSGSGNAAMNAKMRFLCMSISIRGGAPVALVELLALPGEARDRLLSASDEAAREALVAVGEAYANRLSSGISIPNSVEPTMTQVFFPVEGGYVTLSPLYSYAMGAELHSRLAKRHGNEDRNLQERIETRVAHVGGTKPRNAGLLSTYIFGRFPRLLGLPRTAQANDGREIRGMLMKNRLKVADGYVTFEAVEAYAAAWSNFDSQPNVATRRNYHEAIGSMCECVLSNLAALARENGIHLAQHGSLLLAEEDRLPDGDDTIAVLLGMRKEPPTDDLRLAVADEVARKVGARIHGKSVGHKGRARILVYDDAVHDLFSGIAFQKIEEFA